MMHKQNANDLVPIRDEYIRKVTVGEIKPQCSYSLIEYDTSWLELFDKEANRIRSVLGNRVLQDYADAKASGQMQTNSKSEDKKIPYLR